VSFRRTNMKKLILTALALAGALVYAACVDYSDPNAGADADAPPASPSRTSVTTGDAGASSPRLPDSDAGNACESHSFRGGSESAVVCPGTATCECGAADVCCMQQIDAVSGTCTSLGACRALALQCDGPEDCSDGGICCLEDRSGGGSSCASAASCAAGKRLCRTDADCTGAPGGPRCAPMDLGTPGVDDVGLDGIIGVCGL
jgi:hypothetical protein